MTAPRVTVSELLGAADWLRAYEIDGGPIGEHGPGDDPRAAELLRVAEWLDAEIARRQDDALTRRVMREHNVPRSTARRAIARSREQQQPC